MGMPASPRVPVTVEMYEYDGTVWTQRNTEVWHCLGAWTYVGGCADAQTWMCKCGCMNLSVHLGVDHGERNEHG